MKKGIWACLLLAVTGLAWADGSPHSGVAPGATGLRPKLIVPVPDSFERMKSRIESQAEPFTPDFKIGGALGGTCFAKAPGAKDSKLMQGALEVYVEKDGSVYLVPERYSALPPLKKLIPLHDFGRLRYVDKTYVPARLSMALSRGLKTVNYHRKVQADHDGFPTDRQFTLRNGSHGLETFISEISTFGRRKGKDGEWIYTAEVRELTPQARALASSEPVAVCEFKNVLFDDISAHKGTIPLTKLEKRILH